MVSSPSTDLEKVESTVGVDGGMGASLVKDAETGDATRSKLDVNIATPAIDMTVRYGEVNILLMHQTFGGTPQFSVVETSQTAGQIVHIRVWTSGLRILAVEACFASAQLDVSRRD